jgi:hydrogenase nickel incorporation protein HypA/HybF
MHELALTQSVVDQISERLAGARVTRVELEIGRLSGVVCDSVRFCFEVCTQGTTLEGARLEIIETAGRALCRHCGADFEVNDLFAICGCGSMELDLIAGEELKIREVEIANV